MTIRIGIAGLGTVGGEAVRLLKAGAGDFARRLGAELRLDAVCDRRVALKAARLGLPKSVRRYRRPEELAADPGLDVVVETLGGLEEARKLVVASLQAGRHVVTANKRLLAHRWEELFETARTANRRLCFEGSVAGGIPILAALERSLAANRVTRVLGILNGTTNFILTRIYHERETLAAALAEAQRRGLAEKDPTLDLDGTDAAHKVAVLGSLVTGRWVPPESVSHAGITAIGPEDMAFAVGSLGRTIRLIGSVDIDWSLKPARVSCHVFPTLVPLEHPLAAVHGEYNAVLVQATAAGDLMFYGKGAGAGPAGSAVVGDLFQLASEMVSGEPRPFEMVWRDRSETRLVPVEETVASFYLRLEVKDRPGALSKITGALGRRGISISRIHQEGPQGRRAVPVFLTTHPARQMDLLRALKEIRSLGDVSPGLSWMRMLG